MTQSTDQERAEFEAAYVAEKLRIIGSESSADGEKAIRAIMLRRNANGDYDNSLEAHFAWWAWQASRRAQVVPQFSPVAQTKLKYLLEAGEAITGYAIENKDGRRGAIDCHGFVYWWNDASPVQMPNVDTIGVMLELESRIPFVESQTTQRAMESAVQLLRILAQRGIK